MSRTRGWEGLNKEAVIETKVWMGPARRLVRRENQHLRTVTGTVAESGASNECDARWEAAWERVGFMETKGGKCQGGGRI